MSKDPIVNDMDNTGVKTAFFRKPETILTLQEEHDRMRDCPFVVEKVVELGAEQYAFFCGNLLQDHPFIESNTDLMYTDDDEISHCILVTDRSRQDGVLVESEGYKYARYSAFVKDLSVLDLSDIPIEHYASRESEKSTRKSQPER